MPKGEYEMEIPPATRELQEEIQKFNTRENLVETLEIREKQIARLERENISLREQVRDLRQTLHLATRIHGALEVS